MLFHVALTLHIISFTCWFAGLFYLPRLFVYHAAKEHKPATASFKVMEHKLYYYIMMPAMVCTVLTGLWLMKLFGVHPWWLWGKIGIAIILLIYHFVCGHYVKAFSQDKNLHTHRFFRFFNEIPTVCLIVIVALVIFK
jgi:putative membrane protein